MTKLNVGKYWDGLLQGNESLFLDLYRAMYPGLLAYGLKVSIDRELVKDAINQTFTYFWEKRASLTQVQQPESYIYTSFKHQLLAAMNNSRSKLYFPGDLTANGHEPAEGSHEQFLIHIDSTEALQQAIAKAISKLSSRKQQLIRLKYYEGLSYADIALQTNLSERTIYNKVHEAIKMLRHSLAASGYSNEIITSVQLLLQ